MHWPDKEKDVKYTGVVFGVVVVLGTVIWVLDTAFSGVLSLIVG
ncbi:MAG: preprotein translocase subunit SecE [Firmicutes bacterium]|nr:preprotein translocase subunit SecE [Bacillota bacterium]